jgi:hypothetical protein
MAPSTHALLAVIDIGVMCSGEHLVIVIIDTTWGGPRLRLRGFGIPNQTPK